MNDSKGTLIGALVFNLDEVSQVQEYHSPPAPVLKVRVYFNGGPAVEFTGQDGLDFLHAFTDGNTTT
jgi:hypothetical protein